MLAFLRNPSTLPACILAGVGVVFVVLAAVLPPAQVVGLAGGSALVIGVFVARLRNITAQNGGLAPRPGVRR